MAIERCDKCGKAFMSQSEVQRHKMYEHPVPISPFEEKRSASDVGKNDGGNMNMGEDDLQKMTSDVTIGKSSSSSNNNNNNNDITTIGGGQRGKKVPFRMFRA